MSTLNYKILAENWINLQKLSGKEREDSILFIAFEKLDKLIHTSPEEAWKVIEIMWKLDSSDHMLANIAAGPVEDILCLHGEKFIDRIEKIAKKDAVFRKLLGAVWGENAMSKEVYKRMKAVAGESF